MWTAGTVAPVQHYLQCCVVALPCSCFTAPAACQCHCSVATTLQLHRDTRAAASQLRQWQLRHRYNTASPDKVQQQRINCVKELPSPYHTPARKPAVPASCTCHPHSTRSSLQHGRWLGARGTCAASCRGSAVTPQHKSTGIGGACMVHSDSCRAASIQIQCSYLTTWLAYSQGSQAQVSVLSL
jgi:hypothetical protein